MTRPRRDIQAVNKQRSRAGTYSAAVGEGGARVAERAGRIGRHGEAQRSRAMHLQRRERSARPVSAKQAGAGRHERQSRFLGLRRAITGAIFGVLIALSAYIAFGDPGGASRAAFLSDPPSDSALGLLNPDLTGARAHTASPPVRLTVASIGVNTTLQALNLQADGALPVPTNSAQAGWYAAGVRPGSIGPAIVVGHVDSVNGPAVFFRLKQLRVGDEIRVLRMDGTTAVFQVDSVQAYPKNTFPQSTVYGPTTDPVLRLITCTGTFDQASQNYLGNLVVSSHLVREGRL